MKYKYDYIPIRGKFFPIIPLFAARGDKIIPVSALVDSGAIISLFNSGVAKALGIETEKGEMFKPTGIGGSIVSYIHEIILKVEDTEIKIKVAFTDNLAVPINLIGREGFFDAFSVLFNDKEKIITLEKF